MQRRNRCALLRGSEAHSARITTDADTATAMDIGNGEQKAFCCIACVDVYIVGQRLAASLHNESRMLCV